MVGSLFDLDAIQACRLELEKRADLAEYTTNAFVDDIDEVREALGFDEIDVFGGSYGSEAALAYLRRHENHVRAVAAIAVKPTTVKLPLSFAKTIQAAVERVLGPKVEELKTLLDQLAKAPARFEVMNQKVTLSRGVFLSDLRLLLYYPQFAERLPALLHDAASGNWAPFGQASYILGRQMEPQAARGLWLSVLCAEDVPAITDDEVRRETAGTWLGDFEVRAYRDACKLWPRATPPAGFFEPVKSNKPVLLIAGDSDPATPVEMAREAAKTLSNSRVVELTGGTHLTTSPCLDNMLAAFLDTAKLDDLPSCAGAK